MRSYLFVPADSERKLAKASVSGASALLLDLEDSVSADRKPVARELAAEWLANRGTQVAIVRVNGLTTGLTFMDLATIMAGHPDGIMLPKCAGPADLIRLDAALDALEVREGVEPRRTKIMPIATETAQALFTIGHYGGQTTRLSALTWGAEDLAAAVGATSNRNDGRFDDLFRLARSLCLAGAAAAGVDAVDTVYANYRDHAGFVAECRDARRMGFSGKLAIHPDQVGPINDILAPSKAEVADAMLIVDAFAADPNAGVVTVNGRMADRPHLVAALRTLRRAEGNEGNFARGYSSTT